MVFSLTLRFSRAVSSVLQNFVNAFIELIVVYYFSLFFNYSLGGVSIFLQGGENFNASVRTL